MLRAPTTYHLPKTIMSAFCCSRHASHPSNLPAFVCQQQQLTCGCGSSSAPSPSLLPLGLTHTIPTLSSTTFRLPPLPPLPFLPSLFSAFRSHFWFFVLPVHFYYLPLLALPAYHHFTLKDEDFVLGQKRQGDMVALVEDHCHCRFGGGSRCYIVAFPHPPFALVLPYLLHGRQT